MLYMVNKDKILANLSEVQQFAAPLSPLQGQLPKSLQAWFPNQKMRNQVPETRRFNLLVYAKQSHFQKYKINVNTSYT